MLSTNSTVIPTPNTPSDWAEETVAAANEAGLVPESLRKNYTDPISRIDAVQMFISLIEQSSRKNIDQFLAEEGTQVDETAFTDTSDKAVLAANALGIVTGVGGGRFDPDSTFTRAQCAVIINRVAGVMGIDTTGYTHNFTDVSGHWVNGALGWPVYAGIISGIGNNRFAPDSQLTCEQAIVIVYRALEYFSG